MPAFFELEFWSLENPELWVAVGLLVFIAILWMTGAFRMALGAQQRTVRQMFVGHALALTGIGVLCGLLAALGLTQLMAALLYGVNPLDPVTYSAVAVLLAAAALAASYLPARRATSIDPSEALRAE